MSRAPHSTPRILKPDTKEELLRVIKDAMQVGGCDCDLNFIDVSNITDFSELFLHSVFNGDISRWDVSNATTMNRMFESSLFNGDLSEWDVARVASMRKMFSASRFNGDLSRWNVACVRDFRQIFYKSQFQSDISGWPMHPKADMGTMFGLDQTHIDENASVFHWRLAEIGTHNVSPRLRAFYEQHAPLVCSIVTDPIERAYLMNDQWRREMARGSIPDETYVVDERVFTIESNP